MKKWIYVICAVILLALVSTTSQAALAKEALLPLNQTNLLQNPGFEQPYNADGAAGNWVRWHRNSAEDQFDDCNNGYNKRPNWSAEVTSAALIHSGGSSQHVGNQWDTWHAGVWQNVPVTAGKRYRFTVHARTFASNDDFPAPSEGGINSSVTVGMDPNGNGLWNDTDVVWSGAINPLDNWQTVSVEATATGNTLTVFTSADFSVQGVNQCRRHLDAWFDSAELVEAGPPPTNTPLPQPTSPPLPTAVPATLTPSPIPATDTPDVPPTDTPVPPTDTPVPPTGGSICVNAFADSNGNGARDGNEGYMGNVTFTVADGSAIVGQALSTGTDQPFCFDGLEPGPYQVAQLLPSRLENTTASNATVNVVEGSSVGVEFGSRLRTDDGQEVASVDEVPTAVSTDASAPPVQTSNSLGGISGLIVLIVGVVLLGGLLFYVLRRAN